MSLNQFEWIEDYDGLFEEQIPSQVLQNSLIQKDIWHIVEDLGLLIQEHHKALILNFSEISQGWLKLLSKLYILNKANTLTSPSSFRHKIGHLKKLSQFLKQRRIDKVEYINSHLSKKFDIWLGNSREKKLAPATIAEYHNTFNDFFNICCLEKWLEVDTYWFKGNFSNLNKIKNDKKDYDGLFEKEIPSQVLQNPLIQKDIWRTVEDLGLIIQEHHKVLTLNFREISQGWLKLLLKLYVLNKANTLTSPNSLSSKIGHFKKLSQFLKQKHIDKAKYINSQLFEEFDIWLGNSRKKTFSPRTIAGYYITFSDFFNICRLEKWLNVDTYWFKGKSRNLYQIKNHEVVYIPEEVWNQLEEHLHYFPEPMQRIVLVIRTLGLRIALGILILSLSQCLSIRSCSS